MKARLFEKYTKEVVPALKEKRKYTNVHQVPRMEKIVVNMGISASLEKSAIEDATKDLQQITGRKPAVMAYLDPQWMKDWHDVKASSLARFLALAKNGRPYDREMVVEDIQGQQRPEPYQAALQYQQKEHMERSVEYGKKVLDLGIKWRS
jgi:hypothetical protein